MELTEQEIKWFASLERCLKRAPKSLKTKSRNKELCSFTIGDSDITVYDEVKLKQWQDDHPRKAARDDVGSRVEQPDCALYNFVFPFDIESTAG